MLTPEKVKSIFNEKQCAKRATSFRFKTPILDLYEWKYEQMKTEREKRGEVAPALSTYTRNQIQMALAQSPQFIEDLTLFYEHEKISPPISEKK